MYDSEKARAYYQREKERISKRNKEWREANKESCAQRGKQWREANKDRHLRASLKSHYKLSYNLTLEERDALLSAGTCGICNATDPKTKKGWHIDHNHTTGKTRGVLCQQCNHMLGNAKDSIETLQRAINYLKLHEEEKTPMIDFEKRCKQFVACRDKIRTMKKTYEESVKPYQDALELLRTELLGHLNTIKADSVNSKYGTVYKSLKRSATLADPGAFRAFVIDNALFDLVDWRANAPQVEKYLEDKKELPAGVNFSSVFIANVKRGNE